MVNNVLLVDGELLLLCSSYCDEDRKANQQQIISADNKVVCRKPEVTLHCQCLNFIEVSRLTNNTLHSP